MLLSWLTGSINDLSPRGDADKRAVRTSAEWCEHFRANAASLAEIPWEQEPRLTPEESAAIIDSLRVWQLGESSNGAHLRRIARKHGEQIGDPDFLAMIECFIAEEQRHGATLGRYLDACGVPRAQSNWGDSFFRFFRHCLANMETFTIPVVMAETHALVFYQAICQASGCPVLRAICAQLLRDEIPHIRMQCERLAILQRDRPTWQRALTMLLQRVFFTGVTLAIWAGHRRALRAGGFGFGRFWRSAWRKMDNAWKAMNPDGYQWESAEQVAVAPEPVRV